MAPLPKATDTVMAMAARMSRGNSRTASQAGGVGAAFRGRPVCELADPCGVSGVGLGRVSS